MRSKETFLNESEFEIGTAESADIAARLGAEMAARFGPRDEAPLSIVVRGDDGAPIAGLNGVTHWRWLYIRHLWVAEALRGGGLAKRLMQEAERIARDRGGVGAYIDTFDPRVAAFYERLGYRREGEIADFPLGGRRIYLSKRFAGEEAPSLSLPR
jgi:GNAT superfamily N-acetyltransferase